MNLCFEIVAVNESYAYISILPSPYNHHVASSSLELKQDLVHPVFVKDAETLQVRTRNIIVFFALIKIEVNCNVDDEYM